MGNVGQKLIQIQQPRKMPQPIGTDKPIVDSKVRNRLKIYKFEEGDIRSPLVFSFNSSDGYGDFDFNLVNSPIDFNDEKNFEVIPSLVLNRIMYFLQVNELSCLSRSCKYFHKLSSTHRFWMNYYRNYFKIEESIELDETLNWKKQFFKRYCDCHYADSFFRSRQNPDFQEYPPGISTRDGYRSRDYCVCGDLGVGKKTWMYRLCHGKFEEDEKKLKELRPINFTMRSDPLSIHKDVLPPALSPNQIIGMNDPIVATYYPMILGNISPTNCTIRLVDGLKDTIGIKDAKKNCSYFLVCFDADSRNSFENAKKYVELFYEEMSRGLTTRLTQVIISEKKNAILCGLKSDTIENDSTRKLKKEEIEEYVKKKKLKGYVELSTKEDTSTYVPFGILGSKVTDLIIVLSG